MRDSSGVRRFRTSRETGHRQIKASPKEMHGTAFATKSRAELLEHAIALRQNAPESIGLFAVVRAMLFIFIERNRICYFIRQLVDRHREVELVEILHHGAIKVRNRTRLQFNRSQIAIARLNAELVFDEIKIDLERARAMRDRRSRKATRSQVKRHVP